MMSRMRHLVLVSLVLQFSGTYLITHILTCVPRSKQSKFPSGFLMRCSPRMVPTFRLRVLPSTYT